MSSLEPTTLDQYVTRGGGTQEKEAERDGGGRNAEEDPHLENTETVSLPATFDVDDVRNFLSQELQLRENNTEKIMSVIEPLVGGDGVPSRTTAKAGLFMAGVKVTPHDDLEEIRRRSRIWLPADVDKSGGYLLHGINKLIRYKNERLLGVTARPVDENGQNDPTAEKEEGDEDETAARKRQCGGEFLYCVQWVNVVDGNAVPTSIYKIGCGTHNRAYSVHGQNPAKFPVVGIWRGVGFLERQLHTAFAPRRVDLGAGKEWFHFPEFDTVERLKSHIETVLLENLRTA